LERVAQKLRCRVGANNAGEFIRRDSPVVVCNGSSATVCNQTSPPTVWANNAGEFIRRYSPGVKKTPLFARYKKNVGITPVSPDVVEYTQV
jgi:hypothetical protein